MDYDDDALCAVRPPADGKDRQWVGTRGTCRTRARRGTLTLKRRSVRRRRPRLERRGIRVSSKDLEDEAALASEAGFSREMNRLKDASRSARGSAPPGAAAGRAVRCRGRECGCWSKREEGASQGMSSGGVSVAASALVSRKRTAFGRPPLFARYLVRVRLT